MDIIFYFFFFPEVESVYRFDKFSTVHVLENYKAIELWEENAVRDWLTFRAFQLSCDNGYCLAARNISILIYRWLVELIIN